MFHCNCSPAIGVTPMTLETSTWSARPYGIMLLGYNTSCWWWEAHADSQEGVWENHHKSIKITRYIYIYYIYIYIIYIYVWWFDQYFSEGLKPPTRYIYTYIGHHWGYRGINTTNNNMICVYLCACVSTSRVFKVRVYLTIDMYILYIYMHHPNNILYWKHDEQPLDFGVILFLDTLLRNCHGISFNHFCDHCTIITSFIGFPDYHCKNHPEWLGAFEWLDSMHGFLWSCLLLGIWKGESKIKMAG